MPNDAWWRAFVVDGGVLCGGVRMGESIDGEGEGERDDEEEGDGVEEGESGIWMWCGAKNQ